jgi:hypothetical protein
MDDDDDDDDKYTFDIKFPVERMALTSCLAGDLCGSTC